MMTRGIKHEVDRFISDLQAQYFPYKSNKKNLWVQLGVRPIQLWEIALPKESLQEVMATIFKSQTDIDNSAGHKQMMVFRKLLKAKKMPKLIAKERRLMYNPETVARYPIGIKEDKGTWEKGTQYEGGEKI